MAYCLGTELDLRHFTSRGISPLFRQALVDALCEILTLHREKFCHLYKRAFVQVYVQGKEREGKANKRSVQNRGLNFS